MNCNIWIIIICCVLSVIYSHILFYIFWRKYSEYGTTISDMYKYMSDDLMIPECLLFIPGFNILVFTVIFLSMIYEYIGNIRIR